MIYPGIQFKAVKGNTLLSDAYFSQIWSHLGIKAVPVHAQIGRRIPEAEQSGCDTTVLFHGRLYDIAFNQMVDRNPGALHKQVQKRYSQSELSSTFLCISNDKLTLP